MDHLINIDNGGTLTDICVWDGDRFAFTKTLTTPYDLSQCLFDGLVKVSGEVFDSPDLPALLQGTRHIRYSTTAGTNALVERKGPRLGLLVDDPKVVEEVRALSEGLFEDLVGDRVALTDLSADPEQLSFSLVQQVNWLVTRGAERLVVAIADAEQEDGLRRILLQRFPRHLLGSLPMLYSWEFSSDQAQGRRVWSCLLNSFLHPTMERFLYHAEDRLREHRVRNPLLIYRNDGFSSRVAKSVALKTYSSGPRGGLEGTRALTESYGLDHVLMIDIGGTTTDVGAIRDARIAENRRGLVEGVPTSFPMSDVHSSGVGGSSIIAVRDGQIAVGPESVGAAPGPACFGFGGQHATITDVNLLLGVLDPTTYLDGGLSLDAERAKAAVLANVAEPLGISLEEALVRMEHAYFTRIAESFAPLIEDPDRTTVAAFGGAGPMSACGAARIAGVRKVLVPRLAAVFSAFGIGFSDLGQSYEAPVPGASAESAKQVHDLLAEQAARDMFQEGHELAKCDLVWRLLIEERDGTTAGELPYEVGDVPVLSAGQTASLTLRVTHRLPHAHLDFGAETEPVPAVAGGARAVRSAAELSEETAVYHLDQQSPGARAEGPAIVEGPFFTARVPQGWRLDVTAAGDLLLTDLA